MNPCPNCGYRAAEYAAAELTAIADTIAAAAADAGAVRTPDGLIHERDAAAFVGWSPEHMRNRRLSDCPIPSQRIGNRHYYRPRDLAAFRLSRGDD